MKKYFYCVVATSVLIPHTVHADAYAGRHDQVSNEVIQEQNETLAKNTANKGFGPQAPRDLSSKAGNNPIVFNIAPVYTDMNLCNIHFHKNAEHKGGEFNRYAGPGDGHGFQSGYKYSGELSAAELKPIDGDICAGEHGGLAPGDTIELHYVHTTAHVKPGPTLSACLSDAIKNPQLRVEAQVFVLVNDPNARDFAKLTELGIKNGYSQALNIPADTGTPTQYAGSTTGPNYSEAGSPFEVSWSVRPKVIKVNIETVGAWCKNNAFNEDHAHGVRNLVVNPDLLGKIK